MAIALVQYKVVLNPGSAAGSFTSATTAGNCLVVVAFTYATTNVTISTSAATIGGSADNFTLASHIQSGFASGDTQYIGAWVDPNCAGGQTAVAVTASNATWTTGAGLILMEWSGVVTSSPVDVSSTSSATTGTAVTSGTTSATSQANEMAIGAAYPDNGLTAESGTYTNILLSGSSPYIAAVGYLALPTSGTTTSYTGTTTSGVWAGLVIVLEAAASITPPAPPSSSGPPVFISSYSPATGDWSSTTTPKTQSATVAASDVFIVLGGTEDNTTTLATPTGGSLSYTLQQTVSASSYSGGYAWTAIPSAQTWTLSIAATGGGQWGDIAVRFNNSAGIGNTAQTHNNTGASALSFTTAKANSAIVAIVLDWKGVSGSSRTWETINGVTPSSLNNYELVYTLISGNYTAYVAYWPNAGAAGTYTVGLTQPTGMQYSIIAVEVEGYTAATLFNLTTHRAVMQASKRAAFF